MAFALKGVAYITGAASGIGQSTAYSLARQGVRSFALLDRNPVTQTVSELNKIAPGISVKEFHADVTDEKAIDDSIEHTVKEFGRLDYAVNNAGVAAVIATSDRVPKDDFDRVMGINANAVWLCQRAQIRQMLKQERLSDSYRSQRGSIVNVASMYGLVAPAREIPSTAYTAAKHAVIGMTKSDAAAFAHNGIRINAIAPGYVLTPLMQGEVGQGGSIMEGERKKVPLQRLSNTEEIGDCIAFLHSDAASYMVGTTLVADGGFSIQ